MPSVRIWSKYKLTSGQLQKSQWHPDNTESWSWLQSALICHWRLSLGVRTMSLFLSWPLTPCKIGRVKGNKCQARDIMQREGDELKNERTSCVVSGRTLRTIIPRVSVWWKTKRYRWGIYTSHIHWRFPRGTGTLKDRDEVERREVWDCEGLVCDLLYCLLWNDKTRAK